VFRDEQVFSSSNCLHQSIFKHNKCPPVVTPPSYNSNKKRRAEK
jgi:hypothetical protein